MAGRPLIVGVGGTTRPGSTTERALGVALAKAADLGCETVLIGAETLPQEPYDPSKPERSAAALDLVAALRRCDGLIVATPSYHGGPSGLVKNALDFAEDLSRDARAYLEDRAVGCIVVAEGPQALGSTLQSLRAIVHALRGWPTPYAATLTSSTRPFGREPGEPADPRAVEACERVARQVVDFARMRQGLAAR